MKTSRRKFLQTTAVAGAAAAAPAVLSSCMTATPSTGAGNSIPVVRNTELFDSDWRFQLGDFPAAREPAFADAKWRALDLPHDWSVEQPFDQKNASCSGYLPGGIGWYRKTFRLPGALAGKRVRLRFDGVYCHSSVWLNGQLLGTRPYGYISFDYDLTPQLAPPGSNNFLAVQVDHSADADTRWYNGSGIYRHVWLVTTNEVHIPTWGTFVTTPEISAESATVAIETRVKNDSAAPRTVTLTSIIQDAAAKTVGRVESTQAINPGEEFRFQQKTNLANPRLWSPDTPDLYSVVSNVSVAGTSLDEYHTPFGVRSFAFDAEKGFHLNGKKTVLKGVCVHHDAGCLGAAVPDRAWERRLQILKEMGCNAIRMSHNPPAPELLDLCDRLGFLVMDEAFDEWARPKRKWIQGRNIGQPGFQGYARDFDQWGITDVKAMVERDKNHPSIILWSIGNEIDYPRDPYYDPSMTENSPTRPQATELPIIAAKLVKAVKEVDTTRPVTAALANISASNVTGYPEVLDIVGYNYQEAAYPRDHTQYPARKIIGSENSLAYNAWKAVEDLPYVSGQFLWTGIDFIGEAGAWPVRGSSSGLLDECGFKKPSFHFRQSLWSAQPMVYLATRSGGGGRGGGGGGGGGQVAPNWTLALQEGANANVVCYTNCESVELFLNGKSLGEKTLASAQNRALAWAVPYAPGTLQAIGKNAGAKVCSFELKSAGPAAQLKLSADLATISADGRSLSHVEVSVTDADGNLVYLADHGITFAVSGAGRLIGLDSGDMRSHEDFKGTTRKAFHGQCLAVLQSQKSPGEITVTASVPGLATASVTITSETT